MALIWITVVKLLMYHLKSRTSMLQWMLCQKYGLKVSLTNIQLYASLLKLDANSSLMSQRQNGLQTMWYSPNTVYRLSNALIEPAVKNSKPTGIKFSPQDSFHLQFHANLGQKDWKLLKCLNTKQT